MILDLEASCVSKRSQKTHRVVLPRLSDLVQDVLSQLSTKTPEQGVEVFILDFADAFGQIPLASEERKHFLDVPSRSTGVSQWTVGLGRAIIVFLRCTQAVFSGMSQQPDKPEARSQLYVDDPVIAVRGTPESRDEVIATAVLMWRLHGFKLAFHKAQRGTDIV